MLCTYNDNDDDDDYDSDNDDDDDHHHHVSFVCMCVSIRAPIVKRILKLNVKSTSTANNKTKCVYGCLALYKCRQNDTQWQERRGKRNTHTEKETDKKYIDIWKDREWTNT